MIRKSLMTLGVCFALGTVHACGLDQSLAPSRQSLNRSPLAHELAARPLDSHFDTVIALRRRAFLAQDVSESAVIGPLGGEIDIGAAGAKVVFPPGALREATRITMTAKAGWNVAYEFAPHGVTFVLPVLLQQDLTYTFARSVSHDRKVQAGYYPENLGGIFLDAAMSLARVSEVRDAELDHPLNPRFAKFYIYHFSGYLLSSGRTESDGGTDSLP